jgi:hypothetical protein
MDFENVTQVQIFKPGGQTRVDNASNPDKGKIRVNKKLYNSH